MSLQGLNIFCDNQQIPVAVFLVLRAALAGDGIPPADSGSHSVVVKVWSLTQLYFVDFSQSRIGEKKCVFNKRTI